MPSGPIPPNPAELLGSTVFQNVAKGLVAAFDKVIFDSPPVIAVTDPAVLSSSVDAVILVARAGGTARDLLATTRRRLSDVRAPLLGVILNAPDQGAQGSTYPYYYSYYGDSKENGNGNGNGKKNGKRPDKDAPSATPPGVAPGPAKD